MKRALKSLLVTTLITLTACSAQAPGAAPADVTTASPSDLHSVPVVLSMDSTSEQIQQAMLNSALTWRTIWMDGISTEYANGAPSQITREQVWIDVVELTQYRVLQSGPDVNTPAFLKSSDGVGILNLDLVTGQSSSIAAPPEMNIGQYVPPLEPGVAHPNPIWGQIGTHISEMAFPSNFAQNEGTFKPVGTDTIAGRKTLAIEWTYIQASLPSWKMWLDVETAVILKVQFFEKGGGEPLVNERVVTQIEYNTAFDPALFGTTPSVPPQFGDINGNPASAPTPQGAAPSSEDDALGQLYFFTLPHLTGQSAQLVRLPGSCVTGLIPCPQLETVSVPFPFNFNLSALSWSPDGKLAAFAYSDHPNGTPTKLWLFDPAANTWTPLAEFPYIDPPFWSPDGTWIAFRVQDGQGGEDVHAIHHDGTELKNLTASGNLPAEGRPYVMDGWFTGNIIVRSALPGSTGGVYLLRVSDGAVQPMFDTLLTKATFVPSPDNAWFAYDDYDYNSQKHGIKVIEPDGANPVEVATFAGGSIYPVVWSPDATRLAFAHSTNDANFNPLAGVYVVGHDGRGMTEVYKGTTVGRVLFSPDGKYLLVEETNSPTGGHLFVINLETLEQKIISAPGLSLDTDWYAPSWRP